MVGYRRIVTAVVAVVVLASTSYGQDLFMRRANSVGHWRLYVNNNGVLFNQSDAQHTMHDGEGGFWTDPSGTLDSMVFGAGLWFGGLRERGDTLVPHVEYAYEPNHGGGGFVPGSLIYDGALVDTSEVGRDNYRVYRSSDLAGPAWPIRMVDGVAQYINDPLLRDAAGPKATLGDEDVLAVYKDTDPRYASDSIGDPFGLDVRTQVAVWNSGVYADVALVHSEMIYTGTDTVFSPVVAVVIDGDINAPDDDQLKRVWQNEGALAAVFYTSGSTTEPLLGATMFGQYGPRRSNAGMTVMRYWDIHDDPLTDSARYEFLTDRRHDLTLSAVGDARLLMASRSDESWVTGDTIEMDFVLFAKGASGAAALSADDSAAMLATAKYLTLQYYTGHFGKLGVDVAAPEVVVPIRQVGSYLVCPAGAKLYDLLGRACGASRVAMGGTEIDMSGLPHGVYFVRSKAGIRKVEW